MKQPSCLSAPEPTLRRLPAYYRVVSLLRQEAMTHVSCTRIAHKLGLDPAQVRKDLTVTGVVGKPKIGYDLVNLLDCIEKFLGWNNHSDAFLVGVGNLGTALLGFDGFRRCGMKIVAAFDIDVVKVGSVIHGRDILPLDKLKDLALRMNIHIGVLTTPATAAQHVAQQMVEGGIRAIWNFTPTRLELPAHIIVENQDLSVGLAVLSHRLYEQLRQDGEQHAREHF